MDVDELHEEMKGEKSSFLSGLPSTMDALCCMQGSPHDDTILHRLLDTIKQLVTSKEDASRGSLFQFLDTVQKKLSNIHTSVTVLALGAASHLLTTIQLSDEQQQSILSLYETVQGDDQIQDSSVGAAFFNSLTHVAHREKLVLELCNIHLASALATLETAQSVFLLTAVENFVVATIIANLNMMSDASASGETGKDFSVSSVPNIVQEIIQLCAATLAEMSRNQANLLDNIVTSMRSSTFHQSVAQLVLKLSEFKRFCMLKSQDGAFLTTLAHVALQHPSEKIRFSALHSTVNISAVLTKEAKEQFLMNDIVTPLWKIMLNGEVEKAVTVAHSYFTCVNKDDSSEALSTIQQMYELPSLVLFGREVGKTQLASLVPMVLTALGNRRQFGRLSFFILHFVKMTNYQEGLVHLLLSTSETMESADYCLQKSSWPEGVGDIVISNQKLLSSLLHILQYDEMLGPTSEQSGEVLKCLLGIMKRPILESQVYSQTCAALLKVVERLFASDTGQLMCIEVMHLMVQALPSRLVALQWEVRDTTLGFMKNLLADRTEDWMLKLFVENHLLQDAWRCVNDGESYPRASAIVFAANLTKSNQWWTAFLQDCGVTEEKLVDQMKELLSNDSEAFPRRAAVDFLTALYYKISSDTNSKPENHTAKQKICSAMVSVIHDFDWEVKIKSLEFWEKMAAPLLRESNGDADCNCKSHPATTNEMKQSGDGVGGSTKNVAHTKCNRPLKHRLEEKNESLDTNSLLQGLLDSGFGKALLDGTEDYDSAVKQKALEILAKVLDACKTHAASPNKMLKKDNSAISTSAVSVTSSNTRVNVIGDCVDGSGTFTAVSVDSTNIETFLSKLSDLDPWYQLKHFGVSSDEYDCKPLSLLEDVVSAAKGAKAIHEVSLLSEDEFEDADDMFVDCY